VSLVSLLKRRRMGSDTIFSTPKAWLEMSFVASLVIMAAAIMLQAKSWWTDWDWNLEDTEVRTRCNGLMIVARCVWVTLWHFLSPLGNIMTMWSVMWYLYKHASCC
jgi:hypothetical protein